MDSKDILKKFGNRPTTAKPVARVGASASDVLEKMIKDTKPKGGAEDLVPPVPAPTPGSSPSPMEPSAGGEVTIEDVVKGKFNPFMMYQVPLSWIDFQDSANYNRDPIEVVEKSEGFHNLVESIKEAGQKYPGVARVNPASGLLQITDGWRRALACRKARKATFLCVLSNASDVEAAVEALALNLLREDLPEYKKLDEIKKLHDHFDLTYDEISKKTGFGTKGNISESLLIYEYPEIETPFREKKLSLNQARTLARLAKREGLEARKITGLVQQIAAKEIQLKELRFVSKDSKKKGSKVEKSEVFFFSETKDGGLFYRCKLDPKKPNVGEWRRAIDKAELLINALKKAIKDR